MSLLEVNKLTIQFSQSHESIAVDSLSFTLNTGETLGIVGESGSGKSLTGLAIMGLLPREAKVSGNIKFQPQENDDNENQESYKLISLSEKEKQKIRGSKISMIFQEPMTSLNPVLKCGKQVEEVLEIHTYLSKSLRKDRVLELFSEVALPNPDEIYFKYPHQLSGGQRQRVMIALAIACKPLLIIADEPTTALDVTIQREIINLLNALKVKHNLSIIFISHDLGVISKISDKILVLRKGKCVEFEYASKLFSSPEHEYSKALLLCRPKVGERLIRLPVVEDFITNKGEVILANELKEVREMNQKRLYSKIPILTLNNINSYFARNANIFGSNKNSIHVLKDVNLEIWKGETVGLVGESGSGKTTLGRVIMHLIENVTGNIQYKGSEISKFKGKQLKNFRKTVQLVFQDPYSSLSPNQIIGNAILEPMIVHKIFKNRNEQLEKVFELFDLTGLHRDWFYRYPHQLSGGQRQRIVIARALALQPEILICDESVSALDVSMQAQILNLLNDLKTKLNLTYLFISHDLAVVKYLADRIIVMKNGQILEQGEADALCANPINSYTKSLLESVFD